MTTRLSQKVEGIMDTEMGDLGRAIYRNQCIKASIDPDELTKGDLPKVAKLLSEVMFTFGMDRAVRVRTEIGKLHDLESIVQREEDPSKQMEGLFSLAEVSRFSSDFETALRYYERLVELAQSSNNIQYRALAYWGVGMVRSDMVDNYSALESFERGLEIANRLDDAPLVAKLQYGIGRCHLRRGSYEEALHFLGNAEKRAGTDKTLVCKVKMDVGLVHDAQGNYVGAVQSIQEAIDIATEAGEKYDLARMHNNLGEVQKHLGNHELALGEYAKALKLSEEIKNERLMAYTLGNSAECHARMGKSSLAEDEARKALDLAVGSRDDFAVAAVLLTLGAIYHIHKAYRLADENFTQAERIFRKIQSPYDLGMAYLEHGRSMRAAGRREEARGLFTNALATFKEIGSAKFIQQAEKELKSK